MNKREQEQFVAYFEQIYEAEQIFDFIKQQIGQSHGFNPNLLFELISERGQSITLQQMRAYLNDKVAVNQRELYEIFERFDWTRQGSISRQDFLNQITPYGKQVVPFNLKSGTISSQIQGHFISLIVEILKRFRIVEVARKQIRHIQPYNAFQEIDYHKKGYIGIGELRRLFYENDFNVNDKQLYYLLHGLRRRCYRDINLEVFCENLDPLELGEYVAYQNQLDIEKQKDYLNRSRYDEETMKRSRVQAQRIQHQFQKAQRKRQAELERQLELQDRVNGEIQKHEEQKQRQIRRALLEEDKIIRHHNIAGEEILRQQHLRNVQVQLQNEYLNSRRLKEEEKNNILLDSALNVEKNLERSRRALELQRQRQINYLQQIQRQKQIIRQAAVERQLQQSKKRIIQESRRRYEEQTLKNIEAQSRRRYQDSLYRVKYEENLPARRYQQQLSRIRQQQEKYQQLIKASSRKIEDTRKIREDSRYQDERRRYNNEEGRESQLRRQIQLQRLKARQQIQGKLSSSKYNEYQKELQKTRYDIQARRSQWGAENSASSYK